MPNKTRVFFFPKLDRGRENKMSKLSKAETKSTSGSGKYVKQEEKSEYVQNASRRGESWIVRHLGSLGPLVRIAFGIIWIIDGALKFQPGFVQSLPRLMQNVSTGQPTWLSGWFSFWNSLILSNPQGFALGQGTVELALGVALVFGVLRKVAYVGGFLLSLMIWSVAEGFGGPYGPSSTDLGTGIVYAIVFLFLILLNATNGGSRISLDSVIERKWHSWRKLVEFRS